MRYISGGETGNVELPFFASSSSSPFAQKKQQEKQIRCSGDICYFAQKVSGSMQMGGKTA